MLNTTVAINTNNGLLFSPGVGGTFDVVPISGGGSLQLADTSGGTVGWSWAATACRRPSAGDRRQRRLDQGGRRQLVLIGSDSYSGGTLVNAGVLQIGSGGTLGSLAGNITNNAALVFNRSGNPTFGGASAAAGT